MAEVVCECGAVVNGKGALASHKRGSAHRERMERALQNAGDELRKDRPEQELEPLEPGDEIDDRPIKRVGGQKAGADPSADIQAEIARGSGEYKGIDEDDYAAAMKRDSARIDKDDLDVRDVTGAQRDGRHRAGRRDGDEFAFDRQIESEGEPSENRIKDAPDQFTDRSDYGRETLERLRRGGITDDDFGDGPAMMHADEVNRGRRHRSPDDTADRSDQYDEQVGDSAKKIDAVFDWCKDYRGFRHTFSRFYYRKGVLVDFFRGDDEASRREVADKCRQIAQFNHRRPRSQRIGYLAAVVGSQLPYENLVRAMDGQVVPNLEDHLPREGGMMQRERTVDQDQYAFREEKVEPARFRSDAEAMRESNVSRPADADTVAVTIDGVQYYVPRAVADGFAKLAEQVFEGDRVAKASL